MTLNPATDLFLVNSNNETKTVTGANLVATIGNDDLMLVNRSNQTYTISGAEVKDSLGGSSIYPNADDISGPISGDGSQGNPFLLTQVIVFPYGSTAESLEQITIDNMAPDSPGSFTNLSDDTYKAKFNQPGLSTDANGSWTGRLVYSDTPNSTSDATYVGDFQIGSVFFRWSVEQLSEVPTKPPVIGSVNLVESNPDTAPRFTDQSFVTTVTMTDQGKPQSGKEFQAKVEGSITTTDNFSEVPVAVNAQSNVYSSSVLYGTPSAGMFTEGTDTYTTAQYATFEGGPTVPSITGECVYCTGFPPVSYPPNAVLQLNGYSNDGLMFSGYQMAVLADGTRVEANGGSSATTPGWVRVDLAGQTSPVVGFGFSNGNRKLNITSVEVGLVGNPSSGPLQDAFVLLDAQTQLNFNGSINTSDRTIIDKGDVVTQGTTGASGTVLSDPAGSQMTVTGSGWNTSGAVIGPEKIVTIDNATKYLEFNSAGTVASLRDTPMNPPVVLNDANPELTLTFPPKFPSEQTPDDELGDGTTLTVDVKAVSDAFEDEQSSNTVQPSAGTSPLPPGTLSGLALTYNGDGTSPRQITNGIDSRTTPTLWWIKAISGINAGGYSWTCVDTVRQFAPGSVSALFLNADVAEAIGDSYFTGNLTANSFEVTSSGNVNADAVQYVAYSFVQSPGYFDIVKYNGTSANQDETQTVPHTLGSVPGCMIIKRVSDVEDWAVYHQGVPDPAKAVGKLNTNGAFGTGDNVKNWGQTLPTSTEFTVNGDTMTGRVGSEYIAYLFGDTEGSIKCGSWDANGSPLQIDCGFEPQWLLVKEYIITGNNWFLFDNKRSNYALKVNLSAEQELWNSNAPQFNSTGFSIPASGTLASSGSYVFVAIAAPVVRSLTEAEYKEQALKFATYQNRKEVECGKMAEQKRDNLIVDLAESGYDLPDILEYM